MRIENLVKDFLRMFCRYVLLVIGGTCLFIILAAIFGYLAYSDRPGPGWYGLFPNLTLSGLLQLLSFISGWALFVLIYSPLAFVPLFLIVRLFEWAGLPHYMIITIGAVLGGVISLWFMLGMGWYIALGGPAMLVAGVLGAFFGVRILPTREVGLASSQRFSLWRLTTTIAVCLVLIAFLFPDILRSVLFGQKDSFTVTGVLTKSNSALSGTTVRYFNDASSCAGDFAETVTDAAGKFNFQREYKSAEFPKHGPCDYKVTLCYLADSSWKRFWSGGHSGPCGGRASVDLRYDVSRPDSVESRLSNSYGDLDTNDRSH